MKTTPVTQYNNTTQQDLGIAPPPRPARQNKPSTPSAEERTSIAASTILNPLEKLGKFLSAALSPTQQEFSISNPSGFKHTSHVGQEIASDLKTVHNVLNGKNETPEPSKEALNKTEQSRLRNLESREQNGLSLTEEERKELSDLLSKKTRV